MLTIEEILLKKHRRKLISGFAEVFPNQSLTWREKVQFKLWGGESYSNRATIERILRPHEVHDRLAHKAEYI